MQNVQTSVGNHSGHVTFTVLNEAVWLYSQALNLPPQKGWRFFHENSVVKCIKWDTIVNQHFQKAKEILKSMRTKDRTKYNRSKRVGDSHSFRLQLSHVSTFTLCMIFAWCLLVGLEMWMQVQRCKLNILEWRGNTLFEDNLIAKQYQVFTKNYAELDFSDEQGIQHSWVGEVTQLQL